MHWPVPLPIQMHTRGPIWLQGDAEIGGSHRVAAQEISRILTEVGDFFSKAGGSAANTTRALAGFGVRAGLLGSRGLDEWGALWASGMRRVGVDLSRVTVKPGPTGRCEHGCGLYVCGWWWFFCVAVAERWVGGQFVTFGYQPSPRPAPPDASS